LCACFSSIKLSWTVFSTIVAMPITYLLLKFPKIASNFLLQYYQLVREYNTNSTTTLSNCTHWFYEKMTKIMTPPHATNWEFNYRYKQKSRQGMLQRWNSQENYLHFASTLTEQSLRNWLNFVRSLIIIQQGLVILKQFKPAMPSTNIDNVTTKCGTWVMAFWAISCLNADTASNDFANAACCRRFCINWASKAASCWRNSSW
jgi:hypothetical protein